MCHSNRLFSFTSIIVVSWKFYRKQNASHPKVRQKRKAYDCILLTSQTFLSYSLISVFRNCIFQWQGKLLLGSSCLILTVPDQLCDLGQAASHLWTSVLLFENLVRLPIIKGPLLGISRLNFS